MGIYNYDIKRHLDRVLIKENNLIYYSEVQVDNCWDPYQGNYQTVIYTYINKFKFLWFTLKRIHQSVPYILEPVLDGEYRTNSILKEIARKEYYKAVLALNKNNMNLKNDNLNLINNE